MDEENKANIADILASLGTAFGIDGLPEPREGRVEFAIDDKIGAAIIPASAEEVGADVLIAVLFLGYPDRDDSAKLMELLEANYMGCGTGDGTLAVEPRSGALVLQRVFNLPLDASDFVEAFGRLLAAARYWQPRLTASASPAGEGLAFRA